MTAATENAPLRPSLVRQLRDSLRGDVVTPKDERYDSARSVWNADIDRYPAAIAYCADVADVIASIRFAREESLPTAIRCAGHNIAGSSTNDGGLVVDLSVMRGVSIKPHVQLARAQGGCTLGDLDHATQAFGLATTLGVNSITGIAGLTLGGGIGWLLRKHGFSCDNV